MSPALTFSLSRYELPLMLIVVEWCRILSKMAVAMTGSPKISFHWEKLRFEVRISAPFFIPPRDELEEQMGPVAIDGDIAHRETGGQPVFQHDQRAA